jgi:hypothetical protein
MHQRIQSKKEEGRKMNFDHRIKKFGYTFFMRISKTQTVKDAVISKDAGNGLHYVYADVEGCPLKTAIAELKAVQKKYVLSDMFVTSDAENSFRVWCYSKVDFRKYLKILMDIPHVDWNFIYWTVVQGYSTLRVSEKIGRQPQKTVAILFSYPVPLPEKGEVTHVAYDTSVDRKTLRIFLGEGGRISYG